MGCTPKIFHLYVDYNPCTDHLSTNFLGYPRVLVSEASSPLLEVEKSIPSDKSSNFSQQEIADPCPVRGFTTRVLMMTVSSKKITFNDSNIKYCIIIILYYMGVS